MLRKTITTLLWQRAGDGVQYVSRLMTNLRSHKQESAHFWLSAVSNIAKSCNKLSYARLK